MLYSLFLYPRCRYMLNTLRQCAGLGCSAAAAATAAVASCSHLQKCWATSSSRGTPDTTPHNPGLENLTPEQQQHFDTLRYLIARPLEAAQNAALLTALTASYRDLYVVMDQFHKRDILGIPRPLLDEPPAVSSSSTSDSTEQQLQSPLAQQAQEQQEQLTQQQQQQLNHTQMFYPLRDLTKLPDERPKEGGFYRHHLNPRYMYRTTAYAQMLPNHLEVSYQTDAVIYLWPPMEMFYPCLLDPSYMLRHLKPHFKRSRISKSQKLRKVRCSLGWRCNKPYHKQRVFGMPTVPAALQV